MDSLFPLIASALFFAIPLYIANMAPVLVKGIALGNVPIDGGRIWRGQPLLGSHKTWRGLIAGILFAVAIVYVQRAMISYFGWHTLALVDYASPTIWVFGGLSGFGALFGDAVKSFFKRRVGKVSGSSWPPFDQIDFIIGGLVFARLYTPIPWETVIVLLILTPIGHVAINRIAYAIGLKDVPY